MDFKIIWSPRSVTQFEHICDYIALDSETYARIFAERIFCVVENIGLFPNSGRIVPEYGIDNLREQIFGNYRIVYRIKSTVIEIAAICHSAQLLRI